MKIKRQAYIVHKSALRLQPSRLEEKTWATEASSAAVAAQQIVIKWLRRFSRLRPNTTAAVRPNRKDAAVRPVQSSLRHARSDRPANQALERLEKGIVRRLIHTFVELHFH